MAILVQVGYIESHSSHCILNEADGLALVQGAIAVEVVLLPDAVDVGFQGVEVWALLRYLSL